MGSIHICHLTLYLNQKLWFSTAHCDHICHCVIQWQTGAWWNRAIPWQRAVLSLLLSAGSVSMPQCRIIHICPPMRREVARHWHPPISASKEGQAGSMQQRPGSLPSALCMCSLLLQLQYKHAVRAFQEKRVKLYVEECQPWSVCARGEGKGEEINKTLFWSSLVQS